MKRILVFTNSKDATADVVMKLAANIECIRFNSDKIQKSRASFDYTALNGLIQCDAIWYRRPFEFTMKSRNVETLVRYQEWEEIVWNYFLQYPQEKWINYPTRNWYADRKIIQLQQAPLFGLSVPQWIVASKKKEIMKFIHENGESLVKPLSTGYIPFGGKLYHIYSTPIKDVDLKFAKNCPTLVQRIIDKDFDVRTLYVDGKVLFFKMESKNLDVRMDEMKGVRYDLTKPPRKVADSYKKFVHFFGLRFCTSDFVVDKKGNWFFLENNANGNWAWLEEHFPGLVVNHFVRSIKCLI